MKATLRLKHEKLLRQMHRKRFTGALLIGAGLVAVLFSVVVIALNWALSWKKNQYWHLFFTWNMKRNILIYRPIPGFEGKYSVSATGVVRDNFNGRIVNGYYNSRGYEKVSLSLHGAYNMLVHRLVAMAWIDNPFNYPCINHIDNNGRNNWVNNLEWCTHSYNLRYYHRVQKRQKSVIIQSSI